MPAGSGTRLGHYLVAAIAVAWLSLSPLFAQPRLTLDWEAMAERLVA